MQWSSNCARRNESEEGLDKQFLVIRQMGKLMVQQTFAVILHRPRHLTQRPPVPADMAEYTPQPFDEGHVNKPPQTERQQPSTSVTMAETLGGAELAELGEQEHDNGTPSELPEINSMNAEAGGWTLNEPNYTARVAG